MTYDCPICLGVNHASRLHCEYCGTIPPQYSPILSRPAVIRTAQSHELPDWIVEPLRYAIEVHIAYGAERQTDHRQSKHYARTVPFDYYAEPEN